MIRLVTIALVVLALSASPALAAPQVAGQQQGSVAGQRDREIAEDLAVMGQLLGDAMSKLYASALSCSDCHSTGKRAAARRADWLTRELFDADHRWNRSREDWISILLSRPVRDGLSMGPSLLQGHTQRNLSPLSSYVTGYGVVYQMELPLPASQAEAANEAQPACPFLEQSPWKRTQMQLRGQWRREDCQQCHSPSKQKQPAAAKNLIDAWIQHGRPPAASGPPSRKGLVDALLNLLAENGHNFRHLQPEQRVTLALTLRDVGQNHPKFDLNKYWHNVIQNPANKAPSSEESPNEGKPSDSNTSTDQSDDDAAQSGASEASGAGLGVSAVDLNKDGSLDLFIDSKSSDGRLYRRLGDGAFDALGIGRAFADFDNDGDLDLFVANGHSAQGGTPSQGAGKETSTQELAGDLHMRQGNYRKAVEAYENALRQVAGDPYTNIFFTQKEFPLYLKLVQSHVGAGNYRRAQELLGHINSYRPNPATPDSFHHGLQKGAGNAASARASKRSVSHDQAATGARLPARLIVSATKAQLDAVAAGKIGSKEFKRRATVEYVDPNPASNAERSAD